VEENTTSLMRGWFDVGELILSLKLILDIFLNIWFYVGKEFEINSRSIIDFGLKQFWVVSALDSKFCIEFYF